MSHRLLSLALIALSLSAGCAPTRPAGPRALDAPVAAAGTPAGIALSDADRAALDRVVAAAPAATRRSLHYALAVDEHKQEVLVVYEAPGKAAGIGYVLPAVINLKGAHYDPKTGELVAPIAAPSERQVEQH